MRPVHRPVQTSISWHAADQCLLGRGWRLTSSKAVAGAFFAVLIIAIVFETLRVAAKRLDNWIIARALRRSLDRPAEKPDCHNKDCPHRPEPDNECDHPRGTGLLKYPDMENREKGYYVAETGLQFGRAVLYSLITFLGYLLMMFAMSLNAAVLLAILMGHGMGKFVTDWLKFDIVLSTDPNPYAVVGPRVVGGRETGADEVTRS